MEHTEVSIANTGNVPILAADFERPIEIEFTRASILSGGTSYARPTDLEPELHLRKHGVTIEPLLLNPADEFTLGLLIDGSARCSVHGRVAGVPGIEKAVDRSGRRNGSLSCYGGAA